jgi:hypothetical protein
MPLFECAERCATFLQLVLQKDFGDLNEKY